MRQEDIPDAEDNNNETAGVNADLGEEEREEGELEDKKITSSRSQRTFRAALRN